MQNASAFLELAELITIFSICYFISGYRSDKELIPSLQRKYCYLIKLQHPSKSFFIFYKKSSRHYFLKIAIIEEIIAYATFLINLFVLCLLTCFRNSYVLEYVKLANFVFFGLFFLVDMIWNAIFAWKNRRKNNV